MSAKFKLQGSPAEQHQQVMAMMNNTAYLPCGKETKLNGQVIFNGRFRLDIFHAESTPLPWYEVYNGKMEIASGHIYPFGHSEAMLIRRRRLVNIHTDLNNFRETWKLSRLFDRFGRLREEYRGHPLKQGSGIWQEELDKKDILFITRIFNEREFRNKGISKMLIRMLLKEVSRRQRDFVAITEPIAFVGQGDKETIGMTSAQVQAYQSQMNAGIRRFWRSLGFRRIGSSGLLAYIVDSSHLCHSIAADDDFDPRETILKANDPVVKITRDLFCEIPLTATDGQWLTLLQRTYSKLAAAQRSGAQNPIWKATDQEGHTVLHVAAMNMKPRCIDWILEQSPSMLRSLNDQGETPLEALQFRLEEGRTGPLDVRTLDLGLGQMTDFSDQFQGWDDETIVSLAKLRQISKVTSAEKLRIKYGCTCGQCTGGFFSRRMRFAVHSEAVLYRERLETGNIQPEDRRFFRYLNYWLALMQKQRQSVEMYVTIIKEVLDHSMILLESKTHSQHWSFCSNKHRKPSFKAGTPRHASCWLGHYCSSAPEPMTTSQEMEHSWKLSVTRYQNCQDAEMIGSLVLLAQDVVLLTLRNVRHVLRMFIIFSIFVSCIPAPWD